MTDNERAPGIFGLASMLAVALGIVPLTIQGHAKNTSGPLNSASILFETDSAIFPSRRNQSTAVNFGDANSPASFVIFFQADSAKLGPDGRRVIEAAMSRARRLGIYKVVLAGPSRCNIEPKIQTLCRRRAEVIKSVLVKFGVKPGSISFSGANDQPPLVQARDGLGDRSNNHIEIQFFQMRNRQS